MYGRYGNDDLNKAIMVLWIALAVVNLFLNFSLIHLAVMLLCVLLLFRTMSRNIAARSRENQKYLSLVQKPRGLWRALKGRISFARTRFAQRKTHCFFKCPSCGTSLRVPRKKGTMDIRCIRCKHQFTKKIR